MNIFPCGIKLNTFKIFMQKRVNITDTTFYLNRIFSLRYQHQFLDIMRLRTVLILLIYRSTWVDKL